MSLILAGIEHFADLAGERVECEWFLDKVVAGFDNAVADYRIVRVA